MSPLSQARPQHRRGRILRRQLLYQLPHARRFARDLQFFHFCWRAMWHASSGSHSPSLLSCAPSLRHAQICYVEGLKDAPCLQSQGSCTHVFHFQCLVKKLESKWPGARIDCQIAKGYDAEHVCAAECVGRCLSLVDSGPGSFSLSLSPHLAFDCPSVCPAALCARRNFATLRWRTSSHPSTLWRASSRIARCSV